MILKQKTWVVFVTAVPKPRMTQRDKWMKRPGVMKYRAFADELRLKIGKYPADPHIVSCHFWLPMPKSWSKKKKGDHADRMHRQRSDADNLWKSVLDILFKEDSGVAGGTVMKYWAAGDPRIEITMTWEEEE